MVCDKFFGVFFTDLFIQTRNRMLIQCLFIFYFVDILRFVIERGMHGCYEL